MKFKIKPLLISLAALIMVALFILGASRGYAYLQVKGFMSEAATLVDKGMYGEAVKKLEATEGKWTTEDAREEIGRDTEQYKTLAESSNNFNQAKLEYDFKDYEKAIKLFGKVIAEDINYKVAQNWIAVAQRKLAEGEKKETPKGSVAGVKTQAVSPANTSQSSSNTPVPSPKPDDNPKLEIIYGLFSKIGELNGQLGVQQVLLDDALKNSVNCEEKYGRQYLPSGEYNPNFVMTPSTQTQLIQSCQSSGANSILSQLDSIKRQIRDFNRQILDVMATCQTNECAKYYQEVVGAFEAKGYIVR